MTSQTFTFGQFTWDIDEAEKLLARGEKMRVPTSAMVSLLSMIRVNREYAAAHPSPDAPIIMAAFPTSDGWFHMTIDGWHRIAYWADRGAESLSAIALGPQESYATLLQGRDVYRKLAKRIDPSLKLATPKKTRGSV